MPRQWTAAQKLAIETTDKGLLVSAAAGSGKTSVLAERCAYLVCDAHNRCNINELLVVTFTRNAASEMRSRIEQSIRGRAVGSADEHLRKQLRLLDHAPISTLHTFCTRLIRQHFIRLEMDPDFIVLDEDEARLMREDVIRQMFDEHHEGGDATFESLVEAYCGNHLDDTLTRLVLSAYNLLTSVIDPQQWRKTTLEYLTQAAEQPLAQSQLGQDYLQNLQRQLQDVLTTCQQAHDSLPPGFDEYGQYLGKLLAIAKNWHELATTGRLDELSQNSTEADLGRKPSIRKPRPNKDIASSLTDSARDAFKDKTLASHLRFSPAQWQQTMKDTLGHARTFLALVDEFEQRLVLAKRQIKGVDFSDLERLTLRLLCDGDLQNLRPSDIARSCHHNYRHVLVDEYQDINPVQDAILRLLSRECLQPSDQTTGAAPASNFFCVGDVKQSIYRFRLADPQQFLQRESRYRAGGDNSGGQAIFLQSNFRSRQPLLEAINRIFEKLMYKSAAEIEYDQNHHLVAGLDYPTGTDSSSFTGAPIQLHLLPAAAPNQFTNDASTGNDGGSDDDDNALDAIELEARLIAAQLRNLMGHGQQPRMNVMQQGAGGLTPRPIRYSDCVILLQTMKHKAGQIAGVLRRLGIPVYNERGSDFFASVEIRDMLALLHVLDNQQQDIHLAAVLRSPIASLPQPEDAMMRIRLAYPDRDVPVSFHQAVQHYPKDHDDELAAFLRGFLAQLDRWRDAVLKRPLAEVIWEIYDQSGYLAYTAGLEDGRQRSANLVHLHERARQFGSFRRQGLYRFLQFLDDLQQQDELQLPSFSSQAADAVRIMSIHRSKGLEFPVVFLPDLGKGFNLDDARGPVLIDRQAGLGLKVVDQVRKITYPSLAHVIVRQRIVRASKAEQLRLLYVAMTRAREHLVLIGTLGKNASYTSWQRWDQNAGVLPESVVIGAQNMLGWLGPVAMATAASDKPPMQIIPYDLQQKQTLENLQPLTKADNRQFSDRAQLQPLDPPPATDPLASQIVQRLAFRYPYQEYCFKPAAVAATTWAHRSSTNMMTAGTAQPVDDEHDINAVNQNEIADGAVQAQGSPPAMDDRLGLPRFLQASSDEAAARGTATHLILQHLDLNQVAGPTDIDGQISRMLDRQLISPEQAGQVDRVGIQWFCQSELGRMMSSPEVRMIREQPFYLTTDHDNTTNPSNDPLDRLMIRGRIDLLLVESDGCTIVDYKTDRVDAQTVEQRREYYRGQMELYRQAVNRATGQPIKAIYIVFLTPQLILKL